MTQLTLFDPSPADISRLPRRIQDMHDFFGATPGRVCAGCIHLQRYRQGSTWYKCLKTDHTAGSASTGWRAPDCAGRKAQQARRQP